MRLQGTLRGRVQWWWHIQVPHRQRKNHVLPERHRHFGCRRYTDRGLAWKSLPRGLLLARWRSAVRVRVSLCEGGFILYLFSINSNSNNWNTLSPTQVSRCCGLKITSEGFVVTLAKNNHHVLVLNTLYIQWLFARARILKPNRVRNVSRWSLNRQTDTHTQLTTRAIIGLWLDATNVTILLIIIIIIF